MTGVRRRWLGVWLNARPAVCVNTDGGPRLLWGGGWSRLRGSAGGDDVGVVADGFVAVEVAEAVFAEFGAARGEGRAGVDVGAVVVYAEQRPFGLVGAAAFDVDAAEVAFDEVDADVAVGQGDGLRGRLGRRGGSARAVAAGCDDAEFHPERMIVVGGELYALDELAQAREDAGRHQRGRRPDGGRGRERPALFAERAVHN